MCRTFQAKSRWARWSVNLLWFPLAYVIFAGVGVLVSLGSLPFSLVLHGERTQHFGRLLIHRLFAFFIWYLQRTGLVHLEVNDLPKLREEKGLIIAANHPCLLDAVFVVSQLPNVFCIMKASLASNIVLCGTARLAGYVNNDTHRGLIAQCRQRVQQGANLLVFPEGTRTVAPGVNAFRMGFALVAKLAQCPVQTVLIESNSDYLRKGWPFFRRPEFPLCYSLRLGQRFDWAPDMQVKPFGKRIESYFRETLGRQVVEPVKPAMPE